MLAVEEITPVPGEQTIIRELSEGLRPFYRDDLPHHNFAHVHDDVLTEVLRLNGLQPAGSEDEIFNLIAAALAHDAGGHLPLDPENPETIEERTTRLVRPVLVECGFTAPNIRETNGIILSTTPGMICETPSQKKLRRGDLANVKGKRLPFLATTVDIFHEKKILADEEGRESPLWTPYVRIQDKVLRSLLGQDLSLGSERLSNGIGPFNRATMKNVSWLSKAVVLNPDRFLSKYRAYLRPLVGDTALAAIA